MDRRPSVHCLSSTVQFMTQLSGLVWFILMLVPLILLQRLLHREIQAVFLILSRDVNITMGIFSIIFLPGVFLHESSHFVMAKILRVPTGQFSLIPQSLPDGRLQLGYVETARSDVVRDSLIGAAPLIVGTLFVAYVAVSHLEMRVLWDVLRNGQFNLFWMGMRALPNVQDFYLWFYLVFAVSSTMMPSESDRHAWLELLRFDRDPARDINCTHSAARCRIMDVEQPGAVCEQLFWICRCHFRLKQFRAYPADPAHCPAS